MTSPAQATIGGISPFFIVRDLSAALAFYRDKLGFEVTFTTPADDPFFGIVRRDRAMLMLDWSRSPEEECLSRESRDAVRQMIARLPEAYQMVVLLKDMEELSNEEVAEILGESVAAVKSRLHRARMAIREQVTRLLAPASSS